MKHPKQSYHQFFLIFLLLLGLMEMTNMCHSDMNGTFESITCSLYQLSTQDYVHHYVSRELALVD